MSQANENSELDTRIVDLEHTLLSELTDRFLNGPNSTYELYFHQIDPPDASELERRFDDTEEGVRSFVLDVLNGPAPFGGVILSDVKGGKTFGLARAVSLTEEELTKAFVDPLLQMLLPLQPSVFELTETGRSKYEALLKPFWCIGMIAFSVQGKWFLLVGEWSD